MVSTCKELSHLLRLAQCLVHKIGFMITCCLLKAASQRPRRATGSTKVKAPLRSWSTGGSGCSPVKPSAGTSIMANQGGLSPTQEAPRAPCDFRIETRSHQAHQTPKSWHPLFSGLGLVWAFPLCWLSPRLSSWAARSLPQGSCPPPSRLYHNPPTLFFVPKTSVCKCTLDSSPLFSPASGSF